MPRYQKLIGAARVNQPPSVALWDTVIGLREDADTRQAVQVATIAISDDGIGKNRLSLSGEDAGLFRIKGSRLELKSGAVLDFESNPSLDVIVSVTDTKTRATSSTALQIAVEDVNERPWVWLEDTVAQVAADAAAGPTVVATIVVYDDALGINELSLSGADAGLFRIDGNQLILEAGQTIDVATNSLLDVTVNVDDAGIAGTPDSSASLRIGVTAPADDGGSPPDAGTGIVHPEKIGIGTWQQTSGSLGDLADLGVSWYYNWSTTPLTGSGGPEFVPMIWGGAAGNFTNTNLASISALEAESLLVFNEPDVAAQSNMSVAQAINLWPKLMSTGKSLSSPAVTAGEALGDGSWLGRFMAAADARDYRVDFIAVHYYAPENDVGAFEAFLENLHDAYDLPIWVTEWSLVAPESWLSGTSDFTEAETIEFMEAAIRMMDDLDFVERHAWFAAYDGGDGYHLGTHTLEQDGTLTEIGQTLADLTLGGSDWA